MIQGVSRRGLSASVLVLNRHYMAVHVVPARRAVVLLYRETAEVIHCESGQFANFDFSAWCLHSRSRMVELEADHEDWVRTVRLSIRVPRVIRLTDYDAVPQPTLRFNRRNLFARDGHQCQYCGERLPHSLLSLDHVVPRSRGGLTSWDNVVCCCLKCNTKKGGRTPREARMPLIRKPTRPRHNPWLTLKLNDPRYHSWKPFLPESRREPA